MATLKRTQEGNVRPEIKELIDNMPTQPQQEQPTETKYLYAPAPPSPRKDKTQLIIKQFGELRDDQKKDLFVFLFDKNIAFQLQQPFF
jgi:hypothetical protein